VVKRGHGGKTIAERIAKWDAKMNPEVTATYTVVTKPLGLRKELLYQSAFQFFMETARRLVAKYADYLSLQQEIVSYMERLWYFLHRYRGETLQVMADATFLFWRARGFDEELLREAAKALGINISSWDVLLGRIGLSEEVIYTAVKKALEDAKTLREPEIGQDPIDVKYTYDPSTGRLTEALITNLKTGQKRRITYIYDAQGNLIQTKEEDVT